MERQDAAQIIEAIGESDTGVAIFVSAERIVAVQPPVPLTVDVRADGSLAMPLRELFGSSPTIGVVLLRLGRYAVAVLRGDKLLATKTDSRYMKNRHRAGGQSQRRFARSRERLIRELYDKTCEVTRSVFEPYSGEMKYVMLGGESGTLDGFVKTVRPDAPPGAQNTFTKTFSKSTQPEGSGRHRLRGLEEPSYVLRTGLNLTGPYSRHRRPEWPRLRIRIPRTPGRGRHVRPHRPFQDDP